MSHLFDYTPKDRMAGYQAPALAAAGGTATRWLYNKDRELMQVQRPGGASLRLNCSATRGQLLPEALERGGKLYRILTAHLGSVRVVVNTQIGQAV